MIDKNGNKDYDSFTKVVEMFVNKSMYTIEIKLSDGQTMEHEATNIMRALEYIAEQAGKVFSMGGVEIDEILIKVKS